MDTRKKVADIIKAHPFISFTGIRNYFPDVDATELRIYYNQINGIKDEATSAASVADSEGDSNRKSRKPKREAEKMKSAKQKSETDKKRSSAKKATGAKKKSPKQLIFPYLDKYPQNSLDELRNAFPDIRETILERNYNQWQKQNMEKTDTKPQKAEKRKQQDSLSAKVFKFLDQNPETKISGLRSEFPEAKNSTLNVLLSRWRKQQTSEATPRKSTGKTAAKKSVPAATKEKKTRSKPEPAEQQAPAPQKPTVNDAQAEQTRETINALKQTIAAHEKTIETMKLMIEKLMAGDYTDDSETPEELKGLSLTEIKRIAASYIRSIRELPSKFKGK